MKPKVLQVVTDTNLAGAGRYLLYLLEQPIMQDFRIRVACPRGCLYDELEAQGIDVLELTEGDRSASLSNFRQVMAFSREGYDIVHCHSSLGARFAGRLSGSLVIVTKHGLSAPAGGTLGRAASRLAWVFLADHCIAVSQAVKRALMAQGCPEKHIRVIYNGIQTPPQDNLEALSLRQSFGGNPIIGMVARMVPEKGYDVYLEAASRLKDSLPNARHVLVGDGPERSRLERLSMDLGLGGGVVFTGHVKNVWEILSALDIFVLSSLEEGLGLAALEAMASGIPVVASRVGGLEEVVVEGETGHLFESGDTQGLACALLSLADNPDRAMAMGDSGRQRVKEVFSSQRMAEETARLYWEGLEHKPR